ncbi:MAG: hypothetical protein ACLVJ8_08700 [Ruthenibacterium lactatiformans]
MQAREKYSILITTTPIGGTAPPILRKGVGAHERGSAFRIVGFVLGIVGTVVSVTAIVFSVVGLLLAKKPVKPHIR